MPKGVTVKDWMADFSERVKQLVRISQSASFKKEWVWLGGSFSPEAYITATRQQVAQENTWSLEQLRLQISIGKSECHDVFRVKGTFFLCRMVVHLQE